MVNKLSRNKIIIISDKNKKSIKIKELISNLLKKKTSKKKFNDNYWWRWLYA